MRLQSIILRLTYLDPRHGSFLKLLIYASIIILLLSTLCLIFERKVNKDIHSIWEALWWMFVTMTTTGYGDKIPLTPLGRITAVVAMFFGICVSSLLTATVASILVTRKLKKEQGLEEIRSNNHIIICGFNPNVKKILDSFQQLRIKNEIVLICEIPQEKMNELIHEYSNLKLSLVRGDFSQENILRKANVAAAKQVIVVCDRTDPQKEPTDEKTIITVHTIRYISSTVRIAAELINEQNEQHLTRAEVDDIITTQELSMYLLAKSTLFPGIPAVIKELLSPDIQHNFQRVRIPSGFIGKEFKELSEYFKTKHNCILIGILSEERKVKIDDILAGDMSSIEQFIKRKFKEANLQYFMPQGKFAIKLNPSDNYQIQEDDEAIVIGRLI